MPQEKLETEAKDFQTYRPWKLVSNTQITPDVKHYVFQSCDKVNTVELGNKELFGYPKIVP